MVRHTGILPVITSIEVYMSHKQYYDLQSHKGLPDLRQDAPPSTVNVYKSNRGKPGRFLRYEQPTRYDGLHRRFVLMDIK